MCGIVGYVGPREVVPLLIAGLRRLEYRGYDSAGVAVVHDAGLERQRAEGKLDRLVEKLAQQPLAGRYGVAHTRWATHGKPIEKNAHPVTDSRGRIAVIHNGIIENFLAIKRRLQAEGWTFATDTDTEVIANLVSKYFEEAGGDLAAAVRRAVPEFEGMYACALVAAGSAEDEVVAVRQGTPLVLGAGEGEQFLASDPAALLAWTRDVAFLENGDVARLRRAGITIWNRAGELVERPVTRLDWDPIQVEKGGYKHFMAKEIHEQPQAVRDTFAGRVDFETGEVAFDTLVLEPEFVGRLTRIQLLACGTSWHAAHVGKFLIEEIARIPVEVDYASEYRYRDPIADASVLAIGISQSGETIDTVQAMETAAERGARLVALSNVPGSQATRMSSGVLYTHAGPEIGVASTKAFTTQLAALYLLALYLRRQKGSPLAPEMLAGLAHLPQAIAEALALEPETDELARRFQQASDFLYLGRGIHYPIALEGALKLKEISYIHAEGYPAGEMKHGPIALIDDQMPVVALATGRRTFEKVKSNLQEVKARDGIVIAVTDRDPEELDGVADHVLRIPSVAEHLQPLVSVVPLQLLAYQIGVRRGADVDQPRNLAKSVTVE
ncbi:MAG: glutamine--fructose-6-phosphate transaminase (isomerizing) [Thermoanaerobaculia bacterium]|nr:MAG: glutamine--fructose-6-phosphate transaminase (isomerizing) [Thermoanaerobaculia bacterium]MBZ0101289.1 glutamine--fructose-6-phosphate transaminase (isomerizing) [Thermoanaerobaculia bacterium]